MDTFHGYHTVRITIDSGAEGNMMRESTATRLSAEIKPSSQSAHQADGSSPLAVVGELRLTFTRDSKSFLFKGLVVRDLDVEVLAGTPFMELNNISVRPAKRQVSPVMAHSTNMAHQVSPLAPRKSGVLASWACPMLAQPFGPVTL